MTHDDWRPLSAWPAEVTSAALEAYRSAGARGADEVLRLEAATAAYVDAGGASQHPVDDVSRIIWACARERGHRWLLQPLYDWQDRRPRPAEPDYHLPRGWPEAYPGDPQ